MLIAYAVNDGPTKVLDFTSDLTYVDELTLFKTYFEDPTVRLVAHNVAFDRAVLEKRGYHADLTRWRCTMARALAHSLPGGLAALSEVFKLSADQAKSKDGQKLIQLFCKPRPVNVTLRRATLYTHPEAWGRFVEYARLDVEAARALDKKLPLWNYTGDELALWHLDQVINTRGVAIDTVFVNSAIKAVDVEQNRLRERTAQVTENLLVSTTARNKMLEYVLAEYGVGLPDAKMATLESRLNDENLPEGLRELLRIRLQASTSSTAKYKKLAAGVSEDGRLRGTLQYCGASRTGRWSGRMFQPQNLPRPTLKNDVIEAGIAALKDGTADLVFVNIMELTSSALRGVIVAPPGKKLVVSDLSNIEGRDQAWLADEKVKLQAFRDFDRGAGPDLYKLAYSRMFRIKPEDVDADRRAIGKVAELALGYGGGVSAFVTFAAAYGIDLATLAEDALGHADARIYGEAGQTWEWAVKNLRTLGLSRNAFLVCEVFKRLWREAHPRIVSYWSQLEDAIRSAIARPEEVIACRRVNIVRKNAWLRIQLPSGRSLSYVSPKVDDKGISYMGVSQYSKNWERIYSWGGKFFENICQAVARDVMTCNMPLIEKAGYEIVLTVHDEVLTEAPDNALFTAEVLSSLLALPPKWALDMPLAATGIETKRYRKG